MAQLPHKTLFHETAHVILGHTSEADFADTERTPKNLREVEAEAVALLCCEALNLEGADYCRGYIQNWLCPAIGNNGDAIPEKSAQKIFRPLIKSCEPDAYRQARTNKSSERNEKGLGKRVNARLAQAPTFHPLRRMIDAKKP